MGRSSSSGQLALELQAAVVVTTLRLPHHDATASLSSGYIKESIRYSTILSPSELLSPSEAFISINMFRDQILRMDRRTHFSETYTSPEVSPTRCYSRSYTLPSPTIEDLSPAFHEENDHIDASPTHGRCEPPSSSILPEPNYRYLKYLLKSAYKDATERYSTLPSLLNQLQLLYSNGISSCALDAFAPFEIMSQALRAEWNVLDSYNRHRLNGTESKADPNIEEDLELFPFRCIVTICGYHDKTNFDPIYQPQETPKLATRKARSGKATDTKATVQRSSYNKLYDAPPAKLEFPTGNMTISELAAFHPEALRSWDMIDRFLANGGSSAVFATVINHFREMPRGLIENNSVLRMMKTSMEQRAKIEPKFADWSVGSHNNLEGLETIDSTSVSVTGFSTPLKGKNDTVQQPIPIQDFANGVKIFPQGYDALDFTRAVQYCQAHPDEPWLYPTDYDRLVMNLGPATVCSGHLDGAVIARYTSSKVAAGIKNSCGRRRDRRGRLQKEYCNKVEHEAQANNPGDESDEQVDYDALDRHGKKRKAFLAGLDRHDDDLDTPSRKRSAKRANIIPKSRRPRKYAPSRLSKHVKPDEGESNLEMNRVPVRRSGRATKVKQSYLIPEVGVDDDEEKPTGSFAAELDNDLSKFED
ncbi:hypothetical protein ACEQ8H_007486 [Pleosporales sp. CAS-2024a]